MNKSSVNILYCCSVLVLCCVGLLSAAECDTVRQQQEQCFSDLGISFLDMDNLVKHNEDVCRKQQVYTAAIRCALNASKTCQSSMGIWREKFFDNEQIAQWISFMCNLVQAGRLMTLVPLNPMGFIPRDFMSRARRDTCTYLLQTVTSCYANGGISFHMPSAFRTDTFTNTMLESQENMRAVCSADSSRRRTAITCVFAAIQNCMPEGFNDNSGLLDPSRMVNLMEYTCSHYQDINFSCINQKSQELLDCSMRKGQEIAQSSGTRNIFCMVYQGTAQCQKEAFHSCGCKTVRLYVTMTTNYLNPQTCPSITEPTPVCLPGSDSFDPNQSSAGGGAMTPISLSVAALVLAALIINVYLLD